MIIERMLEYLVLNTILERYVVDTVILADDSSCEVDIGSIKKRLVEIQKEFLEPYVINSNPKG